MNLAIGILFLLASIAFNVYIDLNIWKKQLNNASNTRNHATGAIIKAITSIPALLYLASASNFRWILALIVTGAMLFMCFLILFNGFLNLCKKEPFFWYGTEDNKNDAWTDNILQSMDWRLAMALQLILAGITLYVYQIGL